MKKFFLPLMIVLGLTLSGCDKIDPDIQNNPLVEPTHEYEIDTWGYNSEVYEFSPRSNPDMSCVFVMLDAGNAMDVECFETKVAQ